MEGLPRLFEKQDSTVELKATYEQQQTELYAEIGKLTTQVTWLKKSFNSEPRGAYGSDRTRGKQSSSEPTSRFVEHQSFQLVLSTTSTFSGRTGH